MGWCKSPHPLRSALVDLGNHDFAYAAAAGRKRLRTAQLDAFDDFNILLLTEVLDNLVHGMLDIGGGRIAGRMGTQADDVALTPYAGSCCRQSAIGAVDRIPWSRS